MDDLIPWLRAQLDDDEQSIRTWGSACVHIDACHDTGDFMERFGEDRMLAEVDAKRQRIEHYLKVRDFADPAKHPDQAYILAKGALERSLMFDALPYADWPGYREDWRP